MRCHRQLLRVMLATVVVPVASGCHHSNKMLLPQAPDAQRQLLQFGDSALIAGQYESCWYMSRFERLKSRYHTEACIRRAADTTMYLYRYPDLGVVAVGRGYSVAAAQIERVTDSLISAISQRYGAGEECSPVELEPPEGVDWPHHVWQSGSLTLQMLTDSHGEMEMPAITVEAALGDWKCEEWLGIPLAN